MEQYAEVNPFSFHYWTRSFPEVIPFGGGSIRQAHGSIWGPTGDVAANTTKNPDGTRDICGYSSGRYRPNYDTDDAMGHILQGIANAAISILPGIGEYQDIEVIIAGDSSGKVHLKSEQGPNVTVMDGNQTAM